MNFPFKELSLEPGNFADALKGLRFIHLCDLHICLKTELNTLQQLVHEINTQEVDLILISGNIIKGFAHKLHRHLQILKSLDAPTFYVSGKHDYFYGLRRLKRELLSASITCIDNACAHIIINHTPLQLLGLAAPGLRSSKEKRPITELFNTLDEHISTILLSYYPSDVSLIKEHRIDIQVSNLIHNAQAYALKKLLQKRQPFSPGLHIVGKTLLYVNAGLYHSPLQFKKQIQAEIPIFTIT